ncbi:hypothetical protein [Mesorhizobium sp. WSM3224]|uniref:hypothetical protein n=1 Tax=Mesorhizobium sp. WSM3224 TaxID=1040986 RepID=UPI000569E96B|nr:hypothetical protein [Mesorhizobium sp. WSM3224]
MGASQVRGLEYTVECSGPNIVGMDASLPFLKKMHGNGQMNLLSAFEQMQDKTATPVSVTDRNGHARERLAEAFDTTFNVLILVYPV